MFPGIAVSLGGSRYRDEITEEHEHCTIMHNPTCERRLLPSLSKSTLRSLKCSGDFDSMEAPVHLVSDIFCFASTSQDSIRYVACDWYQELESVVFVHSPKPGKCSKCHVSFMKVCVVVGTFALVFQVWHIHDESKFFNQIGNLWHVAFAPTQEPTETGSRVGQIRCWQS